MCHYNLPKQHFFSRCYSCKVPEIYPFEGICKNPHHGDLLAVVRDLSASLPGSPCKTLVVDSLTSLIGPIVNNTLLEIEQGEHKNRAAAWKDKATAYKAILDAAISSGLDFALIYHVGEARDAKANLIERATVSQTELIRMRRALNMILRVDANNSRRSVTIEWARRGRSGITLADTTGCWRNMPELIEKAVYDGLTDDQMAAMEMATPTSFSGPDAAIAWGFEQGVFKDACHAQNCYNEVKRNYQPPNAATMWELWIAEVQERKAEKQPA